jgi:hypothetical protein
MAGGRGGGSLLKKDLIYRCTCESHCAKRPAGYRDLKQKAYNTHQRDDDFLKWRRVRNHRLAQQESSREQDLGHLRPHIGGKYRFVDYNSQAIY